jgi:hypothetical protein
MKIILAFTLFLASLAGSFSQTLESSVTFSSKGIIFSQDESPFWIHSNQRGRIDETTNFKGLILGNGSYSINDKTYISAGVGLLYKNGFTNKLQLDESYLSLENDWFDASLGRKQRKENYNGLSASNQNILWSLNSRPLPGISLRMKEPVYFWKNGGLGFKASIEEFINNDNTYIDDYRVHHKSFHLVFDKVSNFKLTFGLQHFVQWGGTSPEHGKLPQTFRDYLKVIRGKGVNNLDGFVGGQEVNGLGNHLGSYEIYINTKFSIYNIQIIYNHLFEDGSGRVLRNTPDGRYGLYLEDRNKGKLVEAFIYEVYYTRNQSKGHPSLDGLDNYFSNSLYIAGWTYENRILGIPFITLDDDRFRIDNNKVIVHHIGVSGLVFEKYRYKFLTSFRKNYGSKGSGLRKSNVLSSYLDINVWKDYVDVNLQLGTDFSDVNTPNFGAGIQLSKKIF